VASAARERRKRKEKERVTGKAVDLGEFPACWKVALFDCLFRFSVKKLV